MNSSRRRLVISCYNSAGFTSAVIDYDDDDYDYDEQKLARFSL